ncbi:hypothetical protein Pedsa_3546 [Pseudopedobacter saltans DSM 12145]|uniref:GH26 domain-containing protein n=2 Tax=Pseudopedobacter saltans TaxID=151895 RepID=F0SF08_PSESL|nr:hypothetical protein Pedsa_3546 [Pseudopedobacter saltans DSM 12145]
MLVVLTASCKKENQYLPPDFNYEIEPVVITEDVITGAYYSNYTASDWAKKYTYAPALGEYSALDASIMEQHRKWADDARLDFFVFTWNGTSGNAQLNSFINGRNSKVKMVINYSTAHLSVSNTSPLTGAKLTTMINEFKSLANTHFNQDYYYKINGQPVVGISPLNLSSSAANSIDYGTVIPALKAAMKEVGVDLYIIGEITSGWLPPQRYKPAVKSMDAVVLKDWSTDVYDRFVFFPSFSDMNWKNWTDSTKVWNVDFVPCIFPGYNDKVMTPTSKKYDLNPDVAFYSKYSNVAKRNLGAKRIVLINSWNNFQTGTAIEPTKENGLVFLETTRKEFKVNH